MSDARICHADPELTRSRWITRKRITWGLIGAAGASLALLLLLLITAPLSKSLQPITTPSLTLLSAEGVPIARRGAVVETPVDAAQLPEDVVRPFLAIEDRRFYEHLGVDPRGLARALLTNVREGGVVEGGSTITQQLAKLSFLSPEKTVWRKLQEMVLAFWLEAQLSKDEILSRYLSSVYFGDNVFGLRAAAKHYFSREPEELALEQAAMLAGLLKAPSTLAPTRNLEGARGRAAVVIEAMVDAGMLSTAAAEKLPKARLKVGGAEELPSGSYFADWAFSQADAALDDKYPALSIRTTLEDRLQRAAVRAIRRAGAGGAQVALVAMRPDGRVIAMVGGKSYARSPFNRATQALRQPGSTFKLFVYLAALREGYSPQSRVQDRPLRIGSWSPENYGQQYRGNITLRQAFAVSSNVAAVRLAEAVGRDAVLTTARDLGLRGELETGPTTALGTSAVSLIDMVSAYAAIAAGRYPVRPRGLASHDADRSAYTAMDPRVRKQILELLWAAANEGSGRGALLKTPTYGKTGTSQGGRDAYFIGFSGDLVTGVWIGHDDNRPIPGAQGGGAPAMIWRTFMDEAFSPQKDTSTTLPRTQQPHGASSATGTETPAIAREYDIDQGDAPGGQEGSTTSPETVGEERPLPVINLPPQEIPVIPVPVVRPPPPIDRSPEDVPSQDAPATD